MELWDVHDRHGSRQGRTVRRGTKLKPGEYHLVSHVWIVDGEGRFLIQRRAEHLPLLPGAWATTGGSALAGEDGISAALRELKEELGIVVDAASLQLLGRVERTDSLIDVWLLRANHDPSCLQLQSEEVSAAQCVTADALREMIRNGQFHDYGRDYMCLVFAAAVSGSATVEIGE